MSRQLLIKSPEKQRLASSSPQPVSARSFQGKSSSPILQLQRTLGNRRVAQLIRARRLTPQGKIIGLQRKLTVGAADDQYEQEADRVARQVISMPDAASAQAAIARAPLPAGMPGEKTAEEDEDKILQTQPLTASIMPLAQRQTEEEEAEDKEMPLQAKSSEPSGRPVQRQTLPEEEEAKPVQASPAGRTVGHEANSGLNGRHTSTGLFKPPASTYQQVQRYRVPRRLDCSDVVDWLNNHSPYSPEWAQTRCTYSFNGRLRISPPDTSGGGVTLTVKGHNRLTVSVRCPVDRPRWSPSRRTNRDAEVAAWASMRASLDAHEQQHRSIGQTWQGILQDRFRAINFSVTGTDRADAMNQVSQTISSTQQQWVADAQAAQDAIDPFSGAILNCP